ncbi:hypothetical protein L209DRAFT_96948 [Thermothelomyces heterothallicus CBS 203.75]
MQHQVTWAEPVPFLQPQLKKPKMMLPRSPPPRLPAPNPRCSAIDERGLVIAADGPMSVFNPRTPLTKGYCILKALGIRAPPRPILSR